MVLKSSVITLNNFYSSGILDCPEIFPRHHVSCMGDRSCLWPSGTSRPFSESTFLQGCLWHLVILSCSSSLAHAPQDHRNLFKCLNPPVPSWFGEAATNSLTGPCGLVNQYLLFACTGAGRETTCFIWSNWTGLPHFFAAHLLVLLLGNYAQHVTYISDSCWYH